MSGSVSVVLFDYGGVVGDHHQDPAEGLLSSLLGVDKEKCRRLLSERSSLGREFRSNQITENEFWDGIASMAGIDTAAGRPPNALLSTLWSQTYSLNREVVSIMQDVRARSPVGLLTNVDRARSSYLIEQVRIMDYIDIFIPSWQIGDTKPGQNVWLAAQEIVMRHYTSCNRIVYVDDRTEHVAAAASVVGWRSLLYEGVEKLRSDMVKLDLI